MADFTETNEIVPDLFGSIDWQRITGRIVFQTADQNANHFAFQIQQGRAGFATLSRQVYAQVCREQITTEIFSVEPGDQPETGRLPKIERITDCHNRRRDFESLRCSDG